MPLSRPLLAAVLFASALAASLPVLAQAPYHFGAPVSAFALPDELEEISGLTLLDEGHVGAVQDEEGDLFVVSLATGEVVREEGFGDDGDYEGIELVGERLFVMTADARVTELLDWRTDDIRTVEYDLDLGRERCNAEGLGADGESLVIVCKNEDGGDDNRVYGIDVDALPGLKPERRFDIDRGDVPGRKHKKKLRPSALARHPMTGHLVVLSSRRETLVSLDAEGAVVSVWDFGEADLEQPEGLAFLPNGDVLISSEGKKGPGVIMRFAWRG